MSCQDVVVDEKPWRNRQELYPRLTRRLLSGPIFPRACLSRPLASSPGKVCLGQIEDHRLSAIQIYSAPDLSQLSYKEAPRTKPRPLPGFFCPESSLYPPLCRDTSWGLWEALMSFYLSTTEFLSTESPLRLNMSQMHC